MESEIKDDNQAITEPSPEPLDQLDREDIEQARRQSFGQKFLAGAELFDDACAVTM